MLAGAVVESTFLACVPASQLKIVRGWGEGSVWRALKRIGHEAVIRQDRIDDAEVDREATVTCTGHGEMFVRQSESDTCSRECLEWLDRRSVEHRSIWIP
jgi:hypothetical protein